MPVNDPDEEVALTAIAALPSGPSLARRFVAATLRAWQEQPELIETAVLLVSELVTNAVRAVDTARAARVELALRRQSGRVIIEVYDNGSGLPVLARIKPDAENGRGLLLVQALSKEWGHQRRASGGKTVFCVLDESELTGRRPSWQRC